LIISAVSRRFLGHPSAIRAAMQPKRSLSNRRHLFCHARTPLGFIQTQRTALY